MAKYECHITIDGTQDYNKYWVEEVKWNYSAIHGDVILGNKSLSYATQHYADHEIAIKAMVDTANLLELKGLKIVRMKVEEILCDCRKQNDKWVVIDHSDHMMEEYLKETYRYERRASISKA